MAPDDLHILIGTTAQLSCTAEYDASFGDDFELLWEKDGEEISLNDTEASRWELGDLQAAQSIPVRQRPPLARWRTL